ncbi:MAG: hypothetical protein RTU30_04615 [Candidatus Thorarchaeota archaeon]
MSRIFDELGVEITKENKKDFDRVIHELVGVEYKNCSDTWKAVKKNLAEDEEAFVAKIGNALSA